MTIERAGTSDAESSLVKLQKKILLVDRDREVTKIVRAALERAKSYLIREEHDVTFALHTMRWFCPDLVMIDLTSCSNDGEIFARQLRKQRDDTPLVCLSNFLPDREFLSAGVISGYSFLAGPLQIEQLVRGVEQILFTK